VPVLAVVQDVLRSVEAVVLQMVLLVAASSQVYIFQYLNIFNKVTENKRSANRYSFCNIIECRRKPELPVAFLQFIYTNLSCIDSVIPFFLFFQKALYCNRNPRKAVIRIYNKAKYNLKTELFFCRITNGP
jgi:hypothetical protein